MTCFQKADPNAQFSRSIVQYPSDMHNRCACPRSHAQKIGITVHIHLNVHKVNANSSTRRLIRQVTEKNFPGKHPVEVSRNIKRLIDSKMLIPVRENARKYVIRFDNNYLLRGIIRMLDVEGFLPLKGESA